MFKDEQMSLEILLKTQSIDWINFKTTFRLNKAIILKLKKSKLNNDLIAKFINVIFSWAILIEGRMYSLSC